jgi:hypothetical protein
MKKTGPEIHFESLFHGRNTMKRREKYSHPSPEAYNPL